ncbi:MAG TPA: hypothetical protein VHW47_02770, partial [Acidimicrobiales bacterium]|nr:hypothetical protein [Acidimicrobiales bacterium]
RQYLSERGPKPVDHQTAGNLMTGAVRTRVAAYSLATLSHLPFRPDEVALDSVTAAGDSLLRSSAEAHRWYLRAGEVLAGRVGTVPPPDRHEAALHELLVGAFLESSRERRSGAVRAVLRMLWADESLEDELALQGELAGAIDRFAGQRRQPIR